MLRGLLLWLRLRHLNGRTVGLGTGEGGYFGLREVRVSPLGITGLLSDDGTMFAPWSDGRALHWGGSVERAVAARAAGDDSDDAGDGHDGIGRVYRAFRRAEMAGVEGEEEAEAEPKPAISPEEVARILAEERGAPC